MVCRGKHLLLGLLAAASVLIPCFGQAPAPASDELRERATTAREQGDVPHATELYKQALAATPAWTEGWWFLGNLQYQQNQYAEARDSLSQYVSLSPKAVAALALRGLCEYELDLLPASLADIEQAISLGAANQPRNAQILLYHEALLLTRLGRFDEAIAKYTSFVQQGLTNDDIAVGLGLAGLRIADAIPAISAPELQIAAMTGRAAIQILGGDVSGGRKAFDALSAAYPGHANLHYFCGYLLLKSDPDQGAQELREEIAANPSSKPAHTLLAWTLELQGDFTGAMPVAREALHEDPALPTNQLVVGRALLETDDPRDALAYLEHAANSEPQNVETHISLAKAYSELGRKEDARRERLLCLKLSEEGTVHAP